MVFVLRHSNENLSNVYETSALKETLSLLIHQEIVFHWAGACLKFTLLSRNRKEKSPKVIKAKTYSRIPITRTSIEREICFEMLKDRVIQGKFKQSLAKEKSLARVSEGLELSRVRVIKGSSYRGFEFSGFYCIN